MFTHLAIELGVMALYYRVQYWELNVKTSPSPDYILSGILDEMQLVEEPKELLHMAIMREYTRRYGC